MGDTQPFESQWAGLDADMQKAESVLADPHALNMQILQSTIDHTPQDLSAASAALPRSTFSNSIPHSYATAPLGGVAPAFSGLGLLAATVDHAGAASALGLVSSTAAAAPSSFGKTSLGDAAQLSHLGAKAMVDNMPAERLADSLPLLKPIVGQESHSMSPELDHLLASLMNPEALSTAVDPAHLLQGLGSNPSADALQTAIDTLVDQINLLNNTFEPVFDNLSADVSQQLSDFSGLPTTDLGVILHDDASNLSDSLSSLLSVTDSIGNPSIDNLLHLGTTVDDVVSLVGNLPGVDLSPVLTPITDVVGDITQPITDIVGGITDPITQPITDIVGGITDPITQPITDIVGGITDPITQPITQPITDVVGGVTTPITQPISDIGGVLGTVTGGLLGAHQVDGAPATDTSMLNTLSSGISSTSGAADGAVSHLLGGLDPTKT
ncbi:MAG TPA: hypothetical protein VGE55_09970 [Limnobacter sp.]|uniref:hypothetical protein n=1 Tax=Limnobacter sp. TaxID=2003368 RepID=UPI002ED9ED6F